MAGTKGSSKRSETSSDTTLPRNYFELMGTEPKARNKRKKGRMVYLIQQPTALRDFERSYRLDRLRKDSLINPKHPPRLYFLSA